MNYWNLIPWSISLISLIIAGLSFLHNSSKDNTASIREDDLKFDRIKECLLKANMKLDQVCSTTTETRSDIKSMNKEIKDVGTRVIILERDMKTAFAEIDKLKKGGDE